MLQAIAAGPVCSMRFTLDGFCHYQCYHYDHHSKYHSSFQSRVVFVVIVHTVYILDLREVALRNNLCVYGSLSSVNNQFHTVYMIFLYGPCC